MPLIHVLKSVLKRNLLRGILAKKQFCSKSQAGVCVKLLQQFKQFKVDNSLPVFYDRLFLSAVPPHGGMTGHYDVNALLTILNTALVNVLLIVYNSHSSTEVQKSSSVDYILRSLTAQ